MFVGKPESARVRAVRQFWRHLQSSWTGPSRFPPRKRNTTLVLEVLETRLKSSGNREGEQAQCNRRGTLLQWLPQSIPRKCPVGRPFSRAEGELELPRSGLLARFAGT